jgi:CheY-like chemotaxis protein
MNKILIVDDMSSIRAFYRVLLSDTKCELDEAATGAEALEKCLDVTPPDLVFMDIMMPEMDGIEACRRIKGRRNRIKVVIVSNKSERRYLREAQEAGCDGYLTKPVNRQELKEIIGRLLGARRTA